MKFEFELGKLDELALAFAPIVIKDRRVELLGIYLFKYFLTIKISY